MVGDGKKLGLQSSFVRPLQIGQNGSQSVRKCVTMDAKGAGTDGDGNEISPRADLESMAIA